MDEKGTLTVRGYAKTLLPEYNRSAIKASRLLIKEWDYYLIANSHFAVALTVADNGYMGYASASLLNFDTITHHTASIITPFSMGKLRMPGTTKAGNVLFEHPKGSFTFEITPKGRHLHCEMSSFKDEKPFMADLLLTDEPEESMVIATPFAEKKTAFYFNQKINGMHAEGRAEFDGKSYLFLPDNSFATLDWGRGVWPYSNVWYWSSASGLVDGVPFGFNLGYGFGDTSAASENMLFYNGKAHKLDQVVFNIPKDGTGRDDLMNSWTFGSNDGRFQMTFAPVLDRASRTDALIVCSDQHQVFGRFSGTAVLDDGKVIKVKDFFGFAEKVKNRW